MTPTQHLALSIYSSGLTGMILFIVWQWAKEEGAWSGIFGLAIAVGVAGLWLNISFFAAAVVSVLGGVFEW